jgi:DNA invertase Pin-like site-specific DNA recombinase
MTGTRPDTIGHPLLREFLRVSKDRSGREKSPDQQHGDHVRDAERHGFRLHPNPYREVGSASRYAKKERDEFPTLIADLQNGQLGADGIALWEGSRGSRKVSEWALLLDLLSEHRKLVWIHTHGRMYDPTKHRDRRTLLEEAVDAEYESGKTSDRLVRDHADRAAAGQAVGRLTWGYRSVYDERTGRLVRREPDHDSGRPALVVELFERFVAGTALVRIQQDWRERGITNGKQRPFVATQLRDMLRNRVYIGERVHVPGEVTRWWKARDRVSITPGQWEPIVERQLFFAAQAILDDPARVTTRPGSAKHLLSMIARCDVCSGPMCVLTPRGEKVYRCRDSSCATVPKDALEELAMRRIVDYLSSDAVRAGLRQLGERDAEALAEVDAELAKADSELRNLKARVNAGDLSVDFAVSVEPGLRARLVDLGKRREELTTPSELRGLVGPREEVGARLAGLGEDVPRLRRVARLVLSPGLAGEVRVQRSAVPGHRVPIEDRIVFRRVRNGSQTE